MLCQSTTTLEEQSLWYRYKTAVWGQETPQATVVHNIMRVLRSMRNTPQLGYMTTPVSSGRLFYELLRSFRGECPEQDLRRRATDQNYDHSLVFLHDLESRTNYPLIFPPDVSPARIEFEQPHFMALWLSVIAEKCTCQYLDEGWQYSNGCVEEFTHVWQLKLGMPRGKFAFFNTKEHENDARKRMRNIISYDHELFPISIEAGYRKIQEAAEWMVDREITTMRLCDCLDLLDWTGDKLAAGFYQ
jgi:hypothetical protein